VATFLPSRIFWPVVAAAWLAWSAACAGPTADFRQQAASPETRQIADWVLDSRDHGGRPFIIVDKLQWHVFVFDGEGQLKGAAPALLGMARGDESVPGIGERAMSAIRPEERTTPSGRFVAAIDHSLHGGEILWVDYDAAVALHPVATGVPRERRLQRLASASASDKRITYGCINVPAAFFRDVVAPLFRGRGGVVYVLPETPRGRELFGPHAIAAPQLQRTAAEPLPGK
jgi:hypothetical protein